MGAKDHKATRCSLGSRTFYCSLAASSQFIGASFDPRGIASSPTYKSLTRTDIMVFSPVRDTAPSAIPGTNDDGAKDLAFPEST